MIFGITIAKDYDLLEAQMMARIFSRKVFFFFSIKYVCSFSGFPGGSVVKCPPASAGDKDLIPRLGRSAEKEVATHSSIRAWEIPQIEELGGLHSMQVQKSQTRLSDYTATMYFLKNTPFHT